MKIFLKLLFVMVVLAGAGYLALPYAKAYWKARNAPKYRDAEVVKGEIVSVVNATGTVKPVLQVQIGSFVSGPIKELFVNYNSEVKEGDLLATIDPRIYDAAVARDEASLAIRKAEVVRVQAQLQQAVNDEQRAMSLRAENENYISGAELDKYKFARVALEAELAVAEAGILQSEANLANSKANLGYTEIRSPVSGIVIDRKIDPGQTLAAQFQTPEMFVVAPDMEKKMHVFASVDEAEIGLIRDAQKREQKALFTVDAYPDDLFEGKIYQVRVNPTTLQNVVTYTVVVEAPNPGRKLLPGMTANISFEIDRHNDVLKVPNAALRFYPKKEQVREQDRKLLEGTEGNDRTRQEQDEGYSEIPRSAAQRAAANEKRNRRHVWVVDGERLRAIEIVVGLSDFRYTEAVSGDIQAGRKLVTGIEEK
ncbi:MAG: efflux RND transporter periplasmic adaptor subunit [Pirellulales bacterium]|nr:efflux RND transporter periplasmic adaptor subunit [Pirellulales bacterium]